MKTFLMLTVALVALPALAGDWSSKRLEPGSVSTYEWNSLDDSTALNATRCGTVIFSYYDDVEGSDTDAAATLVSCKSGGTAIGSCSTVSSFASDTSSFLDIRGFAFYKVDVTAAPASGTARISAYCSETIGAIGTTTGPLSNFTTRQLQGFSNQVHFFEDFERDVSGQNFGTGQQEDGLGGVGWALADVGSPATDQIGTEFNVLLNVGALYVDMGTVVDTGGHAQHDGQGGGAGTFQVVDDQTGPTETHYIRRNTWYEVPVLPATTFDVRDNQTWTFAYRIGMHDDSAATWDAKCWFGYVADGDTDVMVPATGAIASTTNSIFGIHVAENGDISAVAEREAAESTFDSSNTATLVAGSSWTSDIPGSANVFYHPIWFDVVIQIVTDDTSDDASNGDVHFWARRVDSSDAGFGANGATTDIANLSNYDSIFSSTPDATLENQVWDSGGSKMAFAIEAVNGGTGTDGICAVAWFAASVPNYSYF